MKRFLSNQDSTDCLAQPCTAKYSARHKGLARLIPPILPMLMVMLAMTIFWIEDYFLLEVVTIALSSVAATIWLNRNRSKFSQIAKLFNKKTERITWAVYWVIAGFSFINPAVASGTGGGSGSCSATNTILGPVADALIGVFNNSPQVGATGTISDNICQVFTTFAAIIVLLILGSVFWGLFDNQGRGADLGKAFTPLGVVLAAVVVSRIAIKMVMGV